MKQQAKEKLRKEISTIKQKYTPKELFIRSEEVFSILEITGIFQDSKTIFIYNSLLDEVSTVDFIERWHNTKDFYLPVVENDNLVFRKYDSSTIFSKSSYGIQEPKGENFTDFKKVDLIIVPGMAFDRKMNRMGRGKGYYDRFLPKLSAPKVGICFDFQLLDQIPTDDNDIKMDYLISENELIW
ncbi:MULTISPECIES: 5-formyltetrahydrofolate cyclo-ligase [unclassified Dysgonomonas]|uniref:5-formyltetrahydrofolate cyclo-ligase n=1 Tax=unclassified Dysgonomonas TaxID=2630389 RepID=UPI0013EC5EE0|nr:MULTISPECIES: 5-formyltetrahydrofolate cyclo-ligase [unclassified Dysgonomonas]